MGVVLRESKPARGDGPTPLRRLLGCASAPPSRLGVSSSVRRLLVLGALSPPSQSRPAFGLSTTRTQDDLLQLLGLGEAEGAS